MQKKKKQFFIHELRTFSKVVYLNLLPHQVEKIYQQWHCDKARAWHIIESLFIPLNKYQRQNDHSGQCNDAIHPTRFEIRKPVLNLDTK